MAAESPTSDRKVVVHLRATGDALILKQAKFKGLFCEGWYVGFGNAYTPPARRSAQETARVEEMLAQERARVGAVEADLVRTRAEMEQMGAHMAQIAEELSGSREETTTQVAAQVATLLAQMGTTQSSQHPTRADDPPSQP